MHVTAKPSSFQCNLKCVTVFTLKKSRSLLMKNGWMTHSERVHQTIYRSVWQSGLFYWQGGEPTLAGLDFFRKVIHFNNAMQAKNVFLMHYKRMAFIE